MEICERVSMSLWTLLVGISTLTSHVTQIMSMEVLDGLLQLSMSPFSYRHVAVV